MASFSTENPIYYNAKAYHELCGLLKTENYSSVFVLVDENTQIHCLPKFLPQLETQLPIELIEIEAGEAHKTIETCTGVWNALAELGADRKTLLINLGGGVVTDLGGFVASTFKRGIDFVHIPTSLLAMVDAAIGGKNGVDLGVLKNQVGTINLPQMVLVDVDFLTTLPQNQLKSGLAEMLKHGLIYRKTYWEKLSDLSKFTLEDFEILIEESIEIKTKIVSKDPSEKGLRKILNFGHTLGHAIESYFLSQPEKETLLHGEAIAAGMILESFLSEKKSVNFSCEDLKTVKRVIFHTFPKIDLQKNDFLPIIELLKHDKKNSHGAINFVLLEKIGKANIDCQTSNDLILEAFEDYLSEV